MDHDGESWAAHARCQLKVAVPGGIATEHGIAMLKNFCRCEASECRSKTERVRCIEHRESSRRNVVAVAAVESGGGAGANRG